MKSVVEQVVDVLDEVGVLSSRGHPTSSLKYNDQSKKWTVRADDVLQRKEEIEFEYQLKQLYEITIRTGAIGIWLAAVKKWANQVDRLASNMRTKASSLDTADTPEKKRKIDSELWTIKSNSDKALRKMLMYGSLISAASGLGADRSYKEIKKLTKRRK